MENLITNISNDDYYKPRLIKCLFKNNYEYYEIRGGNKDKSLSIN